MTSYSKSTIINYVNINGLSYQNSSDSFVYKITGYNLLSK
jgi:hypothetical protein